MTRINRLAAVTVAVAAALGLPGAAAAAALTAIKPCYVSLPGTAPQSELIALSGSGFTPGSHVDIDIDGERRVNGAPVDAAGNLGADAPPTTPSPFVADRDRTFTITATEQGGTSPVVVVQSQATALNVGISPRRARPSKKVRFRGRGFTGAGKVYAHYRYKGKTRKTVTFKPKGPCGKFDARKRQIPVRRPHTGEWTVQFDQQKRYSAMPKSVFVRLKILVTRTIRF